MSLTKLKSRCQQDCVFFFWRFQEIIRVLAFFSFQRPPVSLGSGPLSSSEPATAEDGQLPHLRHSDADTWSSLFHISGFLLLSRDHQDHLGCSSCDASSHCVCDLKQRKNLPFDRLRGLGHRHLSGSSAFGITLLKLLSADSVSGSFGLFSYTQPLPTWCQASVLLHLCMSDYFSLYTECCGWPLVDSLTLTTFLQ